MSTRMRPHSTLGQTLAKVLGLAAAYCLAGRLGLLLAIPPGYATAVWPPSGIALAGVLLFGYRAWPGVWLGSLSVNLWSALNSGDPGSWLGITSTPLIISLGAVSQALVGAYLIRRFVGFPTALQKELEVGRFLILGGPVSCLVNATIGITTLVIGGEIPWTSSAFNWWTWWVGDTIGVLVLTPLILMWVGEPKSAWRRRRVSVGVPLLLSFAASVIFFIRASGWEQDRINGEFEKRAAAIEDALRGDLERYVEALGSVASLFESTVHVERAEFRTFVGPLLQRLHGMEALDWIPRIQDGQRTTYEGARRRDIRSDFEITEWNADGNLKRAALRAEYFPVDYLEPSAGQEGVFGFDVASETARLEAMHRACDTGSPAATAPIALVAGSPRRGVLMLLPVYRTAIRHDSVDERRQALKGYVCGVFRAGDIVDIALEGRKHRGIGLKLYDETAPGQKHLLGVYPKAAEFATDSQPTGQLASSDLAPRRISGFDVAGRRWSLVFFATPEFLDSPRSWQAWTLLTAAMLFTALLGAFLLVITGRAAAIKDLVAEREKIHARLRLTVDTAIEAIITMDAAGLITDWNGQAETMFGWPAGEVVGRSLGETIIPPHQRDAHQRGLRRFLKTGEATLLNKRIEVSALRRDGTEFPVELSVAPAKIDGELIFSGFIKDITDRKRTESELQRVNAELKQRRSEMEQFLYAVSHDLKSPLITIQGYTGHLRNDAENGRVHALPSYCARIERAVSQMRRLIDELLELSRIGRVDPATEPVDMTLLIRQIAAGLTVQVFQHHAFLEVQPDMPTLYLDKVPITQVFDNLLVNALTHAGSQQPLRITVGCVETDDEFRFFVEDNGPGIPEEYHDKIFEQFQRLDTATPGTGLGLAIVRRAVEAQSGRVWVESSPGHGATFWVAFRRQAKGFALPKVSSALADDRG